MSAGREPADSGGVELVGEWYRMVCRSFGPSRPGRQRRVGRKVRLQRNGNPTVAGGGGGRPAGGDFRGVWVERRRVPCPGGALGLSARRDHPRGHIGPLAPPL